MTDAALKIVNDATCTFCGCVCDDINLTVEENRITKAQNACVLGKAWFFNHHIDDRPEATIKGLPVSYAEAIEAAADILFHARYPVTYGLSDTTSEAQRVAVAITDGKLDFGPWEQIFYGEFDGKRNKRVLIKVIGD